MDGRATRTQRNGRWHSARVRKSRTPATNLSALAPQCGAGRQLLRQFILLEQTVAPFSCPEADF
eukprot:4235420-Pleurochrysis_carterae.AAC.1